MTTEMNIHEVLAHLPQRYPFILVDKVLDYEPGKTLTAIKNVTVNEPYFVGHFPGNPVMPGVLIIEAMAQASIILAVKSDEGAIDDTIYYFAAIDNARFKAIVEPGDQLRIEIETIKKKRELWKIHAEAYVGDKMVCSADLMCVKKGIQK
jgi:3-hydroxyacyl-[acyl-carrier-protein] dehydratase